MLVSILHKGDDGIILDQLDYIQNMEPISLTRDRHLQKEDPCTNKEATMYRQLVGKLNWIANQSRPDIYSLMSAS